MKQWSNETMDGVLIVAVALMVVLGLVALAGLAFRTDPPNYGTFTRQLIAIALGGVIAITLARVDWRVWERGWMVVAGAVGVLLIGVLALGTTIHGTRGWFTIGSVTLQPVEFAKVGLILLQAAYFRRRARDLDRLRTVVESGAITAAVVVPVLLQPDLGSALLLVATWLGMLVVVGLRKNHLIAIVAVAIIAVIVGWAFLLQPYQRDRIRTFLDPYRDPQGAGYNQRQAVIAVGAGGWWGRGFGQGTQTQLRFLPEAQSDFLPAVLAEEFGFFGMLLLLGCVLAALLRIAALAARCADDFSAAFVVGFGLLFGIQALANVAMNMGVAPVMGFPFPFVSAGGSAVLAFSVGFGIVASIAARTPRAERRVYERDIGELGIGS
ncbi:rod shape-determining protein RodA [Candidatus Uhrbacteria bacterium]|nr:rod shape-determining protein RodA [Candidatus Uhrbacteria bacterium]